MTGEGLNYRSRQRLQMHYTDCGAELSAGLLADHRHMQHGIGLGDQWETPHGINTDVYDFIPDRGGTAELTTLGV